MSVGVQRSASPRYMCKTYRHTFSIWPHSCLIATLCRAQFSVTHFFFTARTHSLLTMAPVFFVGQVFMHLRFFSIRQDAVWWIIIRHDVFSEQTQHKSKLWFHLSNTDYRMCKNFLEFHSLISTKHISNYFLVLQHASKSRTLNHHNLNILI